MRLTARYTLITSVLLMTWMADRGVTWFCQASTSTGTNHWAFQRPILPPTPKPRNPGWARGSLDAHILAAMEKAGVQPLPEPDKPTLVRRAAYDLTGLPPSRALLLQAQQDLEVDWFERVVDNLLSSPEYGEHWGRHWLDVVRYADTAGETADYPVPDAWKYRNYVIHSFNNDLPYDQFLREQIAGDILARNGRSGRYADAVTATGYLAISRRFGFDSENYHHLTIQDTIDNLGQALMGMTLGCARCHDHKYDPISITDYYSIYGIFESTRYAFPGSEQKPRHRSTVPLQPDNEAMETWFDFDKRVASLAKQLELNKMPGSPSVLRSLTDMDGDFEMQAAAAGGSKGVLVAPWVYDGSISVTKESQSPFRAVYPLGKVGVSLPGGTNRYQFAQSLNPTYSHKEGDKIDFNVDFRLTKNAKTNAPSTHRIWMGSANLSAPQDTRSRALELWIESDGLQVLTSTSSPTRLGPLTFGEWTHLHLVIDLKNRSFSGHIHSSNSVARVTPSSLAHDWNGTLDFIQVSSLGSSEDYSPSMELDNLNLRNSLANGLETIQTSSSSAGREPMNRRLPKKEAWRAPLTATPDQNLITNGLSTNELESIRKQLHTLLSKGPKAEAYAVTEGTPRNARVQLRGEPESLGPEVPRGFPKLLGGTQLPPGHRGSGRLELAQWITDRENPLTARVMVNRIWFHHFGRPLVPTPNDFGLRGQPPTHPQLLDYLAIEFIRSGWSIKHMHRLMMTSSTYRQAAPSTQSGNPELYTGFIRRRLNAESIRDSVLEVSWGLQRGTGEGHPFPDPTTWGYTQHSPFGANYANPRRSIYLMTQRIKRHSFLALFDGADPNGSTPVRSQTTVPTQALFFMNDPFVHDSSTQIARRIVESNLGEVEQIKMLFEQILRRNPSELEATDAAIFLKNYTQFTDPKQDATSTLNLSGLAALARALIASNEFIHVD